jgi:hypothetical protein
MTFAGQDVGKGAQDERLVVDDQDSVQHGAPASYAGQSDRASIARDPRRGVSGSADDTGTLARGGSCLLERRVRVEEELRLGRSARLDRRRASGVVTRPPSRSQVTRGLTRARGTKGTAPRARAAGA